MDMIELRPPLSSVRDETRNSVDYISQLPDAIILHIFSFLTTQESIKTSVLSKRWRSTWTSNPYITLSLPNSNSQKFKNFVAFIDAVPSFCTEIKVKRFLFKAPFRASMQSSIDRWLHFAVRHDVEEVSMTLHSWRHNIYALPQFLFHCTKLVSFHVSHCRFPIIGAMNWCSLKRLHIVCVELEDDAMVRVLRGSPVLEFLELKSCRGFDHIKIESRGLRELVIHSHRLRFGEDSMLKISAPHLLKLHVLGFYFGGGIRLDKVSSLIEAELNFEMRTFPLDKIKARGDLVKGLLKRLHHVTKLVMGSWCLQVMSLTEAREAFLPSLECRHLMFLVAADHVGVPGIAKILESSPRVEKLFLRMTCTPSSAYLQKMFIAENVGRHDFDAEEFWNSAKSRIYKCFTHLKHVEIVNPGADLVAWEPVLSMLKFLLQNAPCLDEIVINSSSSKSSKAIDPWVLLEVARTLLSHPKCSPSVKVVLKYPPQGCSSKRARKS